MSLDVDKRLDNLEDSYKVLEEEQEKLPTYTDLDTVVKEIFDALRALRARVDASKYSVQLIKDRVEQYEALMHKQNRKFGSYHAAQSVNKSLF